MSSDPLEPFRDEFERLLSSQQHWRLCFSSHAASMDLMETGVWFGVGPDLCLRGKPTGGLWKAAMALKIAEEQGPDAALLWKLAN